MHAGTLTTDIEIFIGQQHDHSYVKTNKKSSRQTAGNRTAEYEEFEDLAIDEEITEIEADYTQDCITADTQASTNIMLQETSEQTSAGDTESHTTQATYEEQHPQSSDDTTWIIQHCIVAMKQLMVLFKICRHPGCGEDVKNPLNIRYQGFAVFIEAKCSLGHVSSWESQPLIGNIPCINLQLPAATFLTGNSYSAFLEICDLINIKALRERQYYYLQSAYFIPEVELAWKKHNEALLAAIDSMELILAGDARHDSPGHCATFGTYTLLDTASNLIISTATVKVTEVANSYWLEIEGLRRCLDHLATHGTVVSVLTTDRHGGIGKLLREEYGSIVHEYDLWHIVKGLKKKLSKTNNKSLQQWLPSIVNHLWYSAATCEGSADRLKVKWLSLLYHITNRHQWDLALGSELTGCDHAPYTDDEAKARPWLTESSDAFKTLQAAVTSKNLLSDLEKVKKTC